MKKLSLFLSILFIGILCNANGLRNDNKINADSLSTNLITKDVVEKLSNEELINLIKEIEYMKYKQVNFEDDKKMFVGQYLNNPGFIQTLIIALLIFIILIISIPFYFNYRKTKSFHNMINNFVNKGQEISKEVVLSAYQFKPDLHKSIILISIAVGIFILAMFTDLGDRTWAIGFIPLIIGIGYFIISRLEK